MVHDVTTGISISNLEEFIGMLAEGLDLDKKQTDQLSAKLKQMKFSMLKESSLMEVSFNEDQLQSFYGYVSMVKGSGGTFSCAYAFHKLEFKIAPRQKVGHGDINAIRDTFSRYKALDILRKEGVIKQINYKD